MPNIGLSSALNTELGNKYKADNPDFSGNANAAVKAWFRDIAESCLKAERIGKVDTSAYQVASDAVDVVKTAQITAWSDLDAAKETAISDLAKELKSGVS